MKTISIKTLAAGIVAATLLVSGCKKDTVTGPAGPQGPAGVVATSSDGFIKGTITGTRSDGITAINETFNFSNYWGNGSSTLDSSNFTSTFNISRGDDIFGSNAAGITITTTTPASSFGTLYFSNFSYTKSLGSNKDFQFTTSGSPSTSISNLSYNESTKVCTGSYTVTVNAGSNSSNHTATITGSFQASIAQLVHIKQHTSIINAN